MPAVGMRLAHYEICEKLGAGGMGEVYRARDAKLNRDVAIKVLPQHLAGDQEVRLRFEREARAIAQLSHPNVRAIYDFDVEGDCAFAVMEYLAGESLRERLRRGSLSRAEGLTIAVAEGLAAIHQKGIIHRDLKPENIFLTADGRIKILDFGVARVSRPHAVSETDTTVRVSETWNTSPGMVVGTIGYMSPEQVRGDPLDGRSDIFALGAVLFEIFTGRRAFVAATPAEITAAILRDDPPARLDDADAPPVEIRRILARCLHRRPEQRFQSAQDLAFVLRTLQPTTTDAVSAAASTRREIAEPPPTRKAALPPAPAGRKWELWWGAGTLPATALVGVGVAFVWSGRPKPMFLTYTYLTNAGGDTAPAGSPDGQSFAFASQRDGRRRIWVKRLAGEDVEVAITDGDDSAPRYSPDGQRIVFARRADDGTTALYVVSSLGGEPRKIVDDAVDGDWSPDGRRLCFTRWVREQGVTSTRLESVESDGSNARFIGQLTGLRARRPRWSPDGRYIALTKDVVAGNVVSPVIVVTVAGGEARQLQPTECGGYLSSPCRLEDGVTIVAVQATSPEAPNIITPARVSAFDVRTGNVRVVAALPHDTPVCDVRHGRLLYETRSQRGNLVEVRLGARPGEPPQLRVLARGTSIDRRPRYTPQGDGPAFTSNRTGNNDIWRLNFADGRLASLTAFNAGAQNPTVAPDGRTIFFTVSDHPDDGLRRLGADGADTGGTRRRLVGDVFDSPPESFAFAPDGRALIVTAAADAPNVMTCVGIVELAPAGKKSASTP